MCKDCLLGMHRSRLVCKCSCNCVKGQGHCKVVTNEHPDIINVVAQNKIPYFAYMYKQLQNIDDGLTHRNKYKKIKHVYLSFQKY